MEIVQNTTVTLTEKDVSEIIKEYMTNKGYEVISSPCFDVRSRLDGHGPNEYETIYLKSVSLSVKKKEDN